MPASVSRCWGRPGWIRACHPVWPRRAARLRLLVTASPARPRGPRAARSACVRRPQGAEIRQVAASSLGATLLPPSSTQRADGSASGRCQAGG